MIVSVTQTVLGNAEFQRRMFSQCQDVSELFTVVWHWNRQAKVSELHWEVKLLGPCREAGFQSQLSCSAAVTAAKLLNILQLRFLLCGMLVGRIK